ncbi:hypothetical protein Pla52nx_005929 [Stieleria varia]
MNMDTTMASLGQRRRSVMMLQRILRYRIRTLLVAVFMVACLLTIGMRVKRIHYAARFIEANGGDVWMDDELYSGGGFGNVKPRTQMQQRLTQVCIMGCVLLGQETKLWVTFLPNQRERFAECVHTLNASEVKFDVLGETDRNWLYSRLPRLARIANSAPISATAAIDTEDSPSQTESERIDQERFIRSIEAVEAMFASNPQLYYRLDRYETLIGYPVQGEMGRIRDKLTGRTIPIPWPK